VSVVIWF
jgi:hypothetical protein